MGGEVNHMGRDEKGRKCEGKRGKRKIIRMERGDRDIDMSNMIGQGS